MDAQNDEPQSLNGSSPEGKRDSLLSSINYLLLAIASLHQTQQQMVSVLTMLVEQNQRILETLIDADDYDSDPMTYMDGSPIKS